MHAHLRTPRRVDGAGVSLLPNGGHPLLYQRCVHRPLAAQHQVDARGQIQIGRLLHLGADLSFQPGQQTRKPDPLDRMLVGHAGGGHELGLLAESETTAWPSRGVGQLPGAVQIGQDGAWVVGRTDLFQRLRLC